MARTVAFLVVLGGAGRAGEATPAQAAAQPAGTQSDGLASSSSALTFHLLTAEPGDALWELFGHNALLARDSATGYEAAFNYGMFDFGAPGFASRFVRGRMTYWVDAIPPAAMLARYREQNRRVWAQELDLEPAQKAQLLSALESAALPENRYYRYDYFRENCSTKLRDVLDAALGGQIRRATDVLPASSSWRTHTRRLTARSAVGYLGLQLLAGPRADEPTTAWQEMWVPMKLRDTLAGLSVAGADGTPRPLIRSEELWVESDRTPEPSGPPSFTALFLFAGLAGGLFFVIVSHWAATSSRLGAWAFAAAGAVWGLFCGVVSAVVVGMHWTDHEFLYMNRNVLVFSPAGLGVAVLAPLLAGRMHAAPKWSWVAAVAVLLATAALVAWAIPSLRQGNLEWVAFALPVHAGVWWSLARVPTSHGQQATARR